MLFAIPAMTFSTQYNCWELSGDGWNLEVATPERSKAEINMVVGNITR